jgi:hypothetical protein
VAHTKWGVALVKASVVAGLASLAAGLQAVRAVNFGILALPRLVALLLARV